MELFFFVLMNLFALLCYLFSSQRPNAFANVLLAFLLMGVGLNLGADGLTIPNQGIEVIGSTVSDTNYMFTSVTYLADNGVGGVGTPWIFALQWMYLVMGFITLGLTINALATGRVMADGSIR